MLVQRVQVDLVGCVYEASEYGALVVGQVEEIWKYRMINILNYYIVLSY